MQNATSRNGLPTGLGLWHQWGMAKKKKNAAAVALGRLGGLKGGKARARMLTADQRAASGMGGSRISLESAVFVPK
jgi:hypothetical protein